MMSVEQFWAQPEQNVNLLNAWRQDRDLPDIDMSHLPQMGLMVFDDATPVAAGFLRDAEGVGMVDAVVSNPDVDKETRAKAIDLIFQRIIAIAKMRGFGHLIGTTGLDTMVDRARRFGFSKIDHSVMILSLTGGEDGIRSGPV